jgi:hypothetical protein
MSPNKCEKCHGQTKRQREVITMLSVLIHRDKITTTEALAAAAAERSETDGDSTI